MRNPIIVALDVPKANEALELAEELGPFVGAFKIGKQLFVSEGPDVVRKLKAKGAQIFLDLKFHDIPNTVAKAVQSAIDMGVDMLTVHTAGGSEMLVAAENASNEKAKILGIDSPLILGVTVLTSMDDANLEELGIQEGTQGQVVRLAKLAASSGLRGLVCSPQEIKPLREELGDEIQLITPGIRAVSNPADDQKRTMSPAEAIKLGASWLVIGRPITLAANPRARSY
ncbi:MAG: orotidine-5'-phosphate decarboxylase [Limisphaerales bacterium]